MRSIIKYFLALFFICALNGICHANENQERKTVIITGASGELGSAAAKLLASDYHLILTGRDISKLKALQEELKSTNTGRYDIIALDYTNNTSRDNFENYLHRINVQVAGLVLITPRPQFHGKSAMQDENNWLDAFRSTFTGPMEAFKERCRICPIQAKL